MKIKSDKSNTKQFIDLVPADIFTVYSEGVAQQ